MITPEHFIKLYKPEQIVCCFSGGKDSLVATHYVLTALKRVNIPKHVVWADTTIMIPPARDFVRGVCERFGWPLVEVKPRESFEALAERFGMPTIFRRWCCWALKVGPINDWMEHLPGRKCVVTGLRRSESRRRADFAPVAFRHSWDKRYMHRPLDVWHYAPIIEWSEDDVARYIRRHNLPEPPWYRLGIPETCQCGAFASAKVLERVCGNFPEFFQRYVLLEERFRSGGTAFYLNRHPVSAKKFVEQKRLEAWIAPHREPGGDEKC